MQKQWLINEKYPVEFGKRFPEFTPVVLQLLWDRNLKTQEQIDEFFNPDYETDLHDPYLMKDMKKAVKRIYKAIEKNEKILVYGDYDVDGVTSSAIIVNTLLELKSIIGGGEKVKAEEFIDVYIPDREIEGYGLNKKAIEKAKKNKVDLIITVDCGISNVAEITTKYSDSPYSMELALGAGQLDYRSFDLSVLEIYRSDPRYHYDNNDISGWISVTDGHSEEMRDSDKALLQTFGFSYTEQFLKDLKDYGIILDY